MKKPIILYDGYCVLCSTWIQWLIKADKHKRIKLLPLQSDEAVEVIGKKEMERLREAYAVNTNGEEGEKDPSSVILYLEGEVYQRSDAVIRALRILGGGYKLLGVLLWVPRFIRDGIYKWIAANRYNWFGKRDQCYLPESK
jgi:predicted DCC family thiol-disulfide oxidoreductase YuxK